MSEAPSLSGLMAMLQPAASPRPAPRQPDATAMELKDRWRRWETHHVFNPGDLVIHRRGFETRSDAQANQPMLVVRHQPWRRDEWCPAPDPLTPAAVIHDVVVMNLSDDGTAIFTWACSPRLEPWPRQDAAPAIAEAQP